MIMGGFPDRDRYPIASAERAFFLFFYIFDGFAITMYITLHLIFHRGWDGEYGEMGDGFYSLLLATSASGSPIGEPH